MIDQIFGSLWGLLFLVFDICMVLLVLARKREASAALGWSLAVVLLPILGPILFLTFGLTRLPRRLRRKVRHRESFSGRMAPRSAAAPVDERDERWLPLRASLERLEEAPPVDGNAVTLLEQGKAAFVRMFDAVRAAQHHVHIEMYIFRNDRLGRRLLDLLVEKAQAGVEVRLCVDYIGTLARWRLLRKLRKAGGEGAVFLPVWPFGKRFVPNLRNHRKLLVCDGEVAFFGGLNVGEEYLGHRKPGRDWCDLQVEVRGPAVADAQRVFVEDWDFAAGKLLEGPAYFPPSSDAGASCVQMVTGGPDREVNAIREVFLHAFVRARSRLRIASPYVVPDLALRDALATAARSGVEVDLITQSWPPDNFLAELAGSYYFDELLAAGVRIHRYAPGMMHGKLVIADDGLAVLGSANLDNRSLQLNFEVAGLFTSAGDVGAMTERFDSLLSRSEELTPARYEERGRMRRVGEGMARLLAPLL
ncbi:MAG: cardiolipin synthase [Planctomycetota bacterium]|nr:cardiolipin synthase [Planctomycetota bacterium]